MGNRDLTRGNVFGVMTAFALPMLAGNLLQQAYNLVDTWVVGKYVGADALAGVGAAFALMTFLTSILLGLCMGSGVVFSLCFGRRDEAGLRESIGNAFVLTAAVSILLTVIPLACVKDIVIWLNIPPCDCGIDVGVSAHRLFGHSGDLSVQLFCRLLKGDGRFRRAAVAFGRVDAAEHRAGSSVRRDV